MGFNRAPGAAALAGLLVLGGLLSGCSLFADEEQKRIVQDNLGELPDDIDQALRVGKIRMRYYGPAGTDVGADRTIQLTVDEPPPVTAGRWVAGCQAMVAALAPTSGRLYGQLLDGTRIATATDALCQRGIGLRSNERNAPDLWIGLPQPDGGALATGVDFDVLANTIETFGTRTDRTRGTRIAVEDVDPAQADAEVRAARLPWRNPPVDPTASTNGLRATFVVPTGTRLQVRAGCGETTADRHVGLRVDDRRNALSYAGGAPSDYSGREADLVGCPGTLIRALKPQLTYRTAGGAQVDRYEFTASPMDGVPYTIMVERLR